MTKIDETLNLLKGILQDPNCLKMNKSNVKGYFGELYIKRLLESEGHEIVHLGNQSGYDLALGKSIKIDVKFSTIKDNEHKDWAWALKLPSKKRKMTCTHFVCVGVDTDFEVRKICVIKEDHHTLFPEVSNGQFKIDHSFSLKQDHLQWSNGTYFETCKTLMENGTVRILKSHERLIDLLK